MNAAAQNLLPWQRAWMASKDDPYIFATGVMGILPAGSAPDGERPILEAWQDEFLRNFSTSPRHTVRAGHGVGKGFILGILANWFPLTHYDSKCVITANSQDQLRDNNWPELRKVHRLLPEALRNQLQIDEERLFIKAEPEMAFVVRRTASRHNPEALQGVHAKHVLYLIDEASGIAEIVFEVAQGSLSTEGAIAVLMSNPTRASGFFHDTHTLLRGRWKTWRVSSEDVPRARGHIEDIIAKYGKDSNKYRVRVLGEFPTADDDTVIPLELVEAAVGRQVKVLDYKPTWGVDVARFGDDRTVLVKRQANALLEKPIVWKNLDTTQVAARVKAEYDRTPAPDRPSEILVDVIGYGAGVLDQLRNICGFKGGGTAQARGINVAESAPNSEEYHRLRDELWFKGRAWFAAKDCTIPAGCDGLIAELTTPTYDFSVQGKKVVESKADAKKRGLMSPDEADALLLTFAGIPQMRKQERPREWWDDTTGGGSGWTG